MVTSLAKEKLNFNSEQLAELSSQVRQGDLTPVLKIYENDIKSPISSALTGSLIRTLLIQVQKTKVSEETKLGCDMNADFDPLLSRWTSTLPHQESTSCFDLKNSLSPSSESRRLSQSCTCLVIGSGISGLGAAVEGGLEGGTGANVFGLQSGMLGQWFLYIYIYITC